jgi:hypothetical protein
MFYKQQIGASEYLEVNRTDPSLSVRIPWRTHRKKEIWVELRYNRAPHDASCGRRIERKELNFVSKNVRLKSFCRCLPLPGIERLH